jgi:hypothetical protein
MQIVTANRLTDGLVVFRKSDGAWSTLVQEAGVVSEKPALEAALAAAGADAAARLIVEPYAIDVELSAGDLRPKTLRERIRAAGPTVPSNFPDQVRPAAR